MKQKTIPWQITAERIQDEFRSDTATLAVFIAIVRHARDTGKDISCWPSLTRLQKITGLSRGTVSKKVALLEKSGYIERYKSAGFISKMTRINL